MRRRVEVLVLAALCLASLLVGWLLGKGAEGVSVALFFYLLSFFFFLAMFRPHTPL